MKFTLKNLEYEFEGWKAQFKQIKTGAYTAYMMRSNLIHRDKMKNTDGGLVLDTNTLSTSELADFMELEDKFLALNLVNASNGEEVVETDDQKELFINYLLSSEDFKVWKDGYINGPKKT